jgi:two-component system, sensor histidine kinase PdtaS
MKKMGKTFATLDDINAIILVADQQGNIVFANRAIKSILGYEPEDVLGNGWWQLTANDPSTGLSKDLRKSITGDLAAGKIDLKHRHLFESALRTKDGSLVWTQWTNTLTDDGFLVGIAQNITEKKALETELIRKNQENELLLKEIHHRVKNNLQIISSLLNLQFNNIQDQLVLDALSKSKDRINSMAMIHTKLYQSNNLASIDFGSYLDELVASIAQSYAHNNNIKYTLKHSENVFEIDLAINLGLIVTELLTNAYKHAFKNKENGIIHIELISKENKHQLIIADDGIGLDDKSVAEESLGLEIVNALIEQINASLELISENGLKYVISFER